MKHSTIPMTCSLALAAMSGTVFSHWWSLREFSPLLGSQARLASPHSPIIPPATQAPPPADAKLVATQPAPAPAPAAAAVPSAAQQEFFASLLDEMRQLKKTNLALGDQMAETNRDLMKLEFRVDTHSASFRPLPVTEDLTTLDTTPPDEGSGVLPPRAVLVGNPEME
jgi:hypothetical protein